ncbi:RidA family protein [Saccharomonospora xinjiangensis]|uniref:Putative translation initiation inhibitor, yjgF family n=1 Tax=Saccharomonospora xinjiangensis XJ-54 TaxID=882086 RepID=I0V8M3_9PSEU|nr:RidA family protein [Saccharomonospora xinjiangensis]EID56476.1 putative translation initiation inhibitor, yjgF family [Saccharomonospora xinjiangensis XJ-54]
MSITLINPDGLPQAGSHHQMSVATGSRLIFLAGQVAWNADGDLVGRGDLARQVEQCYLNVAAALAEAGATFDDVAKLTVYLVDWTPEKMPLLAEGIASATAKLGITTTPPLTGLGVAALADVSLLAEVEAIAVVDR